MKFAFISFTREHKIKQDGNLPLYYTFVQSPVRQPQDWAYFLQHFASSDDLVDSKQNCHFLQIIQFIIITMGNTRSCTR